jgi:ketosteroid isomerase-like protein
MKKYVLTLLSYFLIILVLASCGDKQKYLSKEQKDDEEKQITNVIKAYMTALKNESFSPIVTMFSKDVVFYGTDSGETIKSIDQIKAALESQWAKFDIKYGEIEDVHIAMDNAATLASVIYGVKAEYTDSSSGEPVKTYLRYSMTLKKEKETWQIAVGTVGKVNTN